jgi:hypothetical protein
MKRPCADKAVRKFRVDDQTIGEMIGQVYLEGRPVERVVEEWLWTKGSWQKWTKCSR